MDWSDGRVDVGGVSIGYRRAGEGPPLVLLHGAYEDSRIWMRQLEDLSDEFTVVAWDAPGCGLSDDPAETFTDTDYGNCVDGLIRALGLEKPHVLGLSWGSVIALAFYRDHPEVPASLVLAGAYAGWGGSLPPEELERRMTQVQRELDLPPEKFVADWIPTLVTPAASPEMVEEISTIMCDCRPAGMRTALRALGPADYRDVLSTITVPTLLLYGDADVRAPVATVGQDMHTRIPGSTLVVMPGAPHVANVETPEAFNTAVRGFLRSLAQVSDEGVS